MSTRKVKYHTKSCSVKGCTVKKYAGSEVVLHRFPRDVRRCREWVKRAGNPKLEAMPIDEIYCKAYICQNHFTTDQYVSTERQRLIPLALPSIFLPGEISLISKSAFASFSPPSSTFTRMSTSCPTPITTVVTDTYNAPTILSSVNFQSLATPLPPSPIQNPSIEVKIQSDVLTNQSVFASSLPGPSSENSAIFPSTASGKEVTPTYALRRKAAEASVLKDIGLRKIDLTPRKMHLYLNYKKMCRSNSYFRCKPYCGYVNPLDKIDSNMSLLLQSQLQNLKRKSKGRRWTLQEKLFFISLYKQSPHTYAYLKTKFTLPSNQTLLTVLSSVPFQAGINPGVIAHLSSFASRLSECDKHCVLLFDEMSIKPGLLYNSKSDCILGFQDHGSLGRSAGIAHEALVFMIRGLSLNWKQPVAYYFSEGSTPGAILAEMIKEVLSALHPTGLKIVASICDMGSNNILALKCLGMNVNNPFFYFNEKKIFTFHDPPHLLKCTRNMFLKHPIKGKALFSGKVYSGIARWSHIRNVFDLSNDLQTSAVAHTTFMPKLTEAHLHPRWEQKMKVELAADVFSENVVGVMELCRILRNMPMDMSVTTSFLLFIHKLFNSLNGVKPKKGNSKALTSCLSEGSEHIEFWDKTLGTINDWVFLTTDVEAQENPRHKGTLRPKSQNGWIITIKAMKLLWAELKKVGFNLLEPRRLNQDPLENLFGGIRLHSGANHNPNVEHFAAAVKTVIIRNISKELIQNRNCSPYEDSFIIDLEEFLQQIPSFLNNTGGAENIATDDIVNDVSDLVEEVPPGWSAELCMMDLTLAKISCKILGATFRNSTCSFCLNQLTANPSAVCENFVSSTEALQVEGRVYYPSEKLVKSVKKGLAILEGFLMQHKTSEKIGEKGRAAISNVFSWLHCEVHEMGERISKLLVQYALLNYCKNATAI